ncbi:UNVERIFIED_CONTAM: hypothetical protein FKN15_065128 [Acipenser sinensis]
MKRGSEGRQEFLVVSPDEYDKLISGDLSEVGAPMAGKLKIDGTENSEQRRNPKATRHRASMFFNVLPNVIKRGEATTTEGGEEVKEDIR